MKLSVHLRILPVAMILALSAHAAFYHESTDLQDGIANLRAEIGFNQLVPGRDPDGAVCHAKLRIDSGAPVLPDAATVMILGATRVFQMGLDASDTGLLVHNGATAFDDRELMIIDRKAQVALHFRKLGRTARIDGYKTDAGGGFVAPPISCTVD